MQFIKMTDLDLAGKRVFIRADLNVPVADGKMCIRDRTSREHIRLALHSTYGCMASRQFD